MAVLVKNKQAISNMFGRIAGSYDFLNHFLSFGLDYYWRFSAIRILQRLLKKSNIPQHTISLLDIATGTGDLAFKASSLPLAKITAIDMSEPMLARAKSKQTRLTLKTEIEFLVADAENLPFPDKTFKAAMVAFGVRNFSDLPRAMSEVNRVLCPNSPFVILEFSKPTGFVIKQLVYLYYKIWLPLFGRLISRDVMAYSYLTESIQDFYQSNNFADFLIQCGFKSVQYKRLSGGIVTIYSCITAF